MNEAKCPGDDFFVICSLHETARRRVRAGGCHRLPAHIRDRLVGAPHRADLHLGTCSPNEQSGAASTATSRLANPKMLRFPTNVTALKPSWLDH